MKTKLLPTILLGLALGFAAFNADAQNPGGVAIAPTIWYQASAYGTSWANAGSLGSAADLTVTGTPTFSSSGDSLSNYNPYVLFSATGQYASTPAPGLSAANVAALGNTHTTFAAVTNQNTSSNNTASSSPFFFATSGGTLDQPGLGFSQNGNSATPIYAMMDYYYHTTGSSEYAYQFTGNGITAGSSVVLMGQADPVTGATNNLNISYNGQGSTVYMNGIGQTYSLGAANGNYSSVAGGTNANQNYVFVGDVNQYAMTGRVQEIVMFNTVLTNTQSKQVNTYLAVKNGVTLGHGYIDAAGNTIYSLSTNSGNVSNIFGTGAEAANGSLNQPKSNSVSDTRAIVVSNGSHIGTNDSYLMFGANGVSIASKNYANGTVFGGNSVTAASILNTISEKWATQSTVGGIAGGSWTVTINAGRIAQNGYVLVSSDSTFPAATTSAYALSGGVANNVNIPSGAYVTIAYLQVAPGGILTAPAVWYKPDSATATLWKDASANKLDLTVQNGSVTVNPGDASHNFNSWTTGYSSANYYNYINPAATNTDLEVNSVFGNYNVNGYSYMPLTVFGVARDTLANGSGLITGIDNENPNASEPGFGVYGGLQRFYRFSYGAAASGATAPVNLSAVYMWRPTTGTAAANGTTDTLLMGLNGTYSTSLMNKVGSVVGPYLKIGYSASDWGVFPGNIQEVTWFKDSLGYTDIQKVETYLAIKYGTTLAHGYLNPAGDTIYSLTANAGNMNNIAGIGHEIINGGLDQRQSNSINTGKQVLISTTGLANTNDANSVGLADGQYLIWGDNGLNKVPAVAVTNIPGTNYRFGSVWKVQNTGSVGKVRVAWPSQFATIKLVQSNDSTFAAGNAVTDMSANTQIINDVTYNYADVILANGQYFTFAAFVQTPGGVAIPAVWLKADAGIDTLSGHLNQWQNFGISGGYAQQLTSGATVYQTPYYRQNIHNFNPSLVDSLTTADGGLELKNVFPTYAQRALSTFVLQDQPDITQQRTMVSFVNQDNFAASVDLPWFASQSATQLYFWWDGSYANAYTLTNSLMRYNNIPTINSYHRAIYTTNPDTTFLGMNGAGKMYAVGNSSAGVGIGPHLLVNADGGNNNPSGGNISEVIVYDRDLTAAERLRVNTYMAIKYGIRLYNETGTNATDYLSSASQVVWDTTTNANYNNNIAGIAYDYNSGLDQKQSKSVNAGAQVLIATTGLANTNGSNATSLTDGQYLIWGDNGLAKSPSVYTGNTFTTVNVRFSAIWKVQNTGSVGTVRVAWPAGLSHLAIIQSADETFDASDVVTDMSANTQAVNGVIYNYADVTLADGQYFTFAAKLDHAPGGVFDGLSQWFRADKQTTITGGGDTTLTSWTDYAMDITASQISTATLPKLHSGSNAYFNFNPGINFTGTNQKIGNISVQTLSSRNYDIFSATKEDIAGTRYYNIGQDNTTMNGNNWDAPGLYANSTVAIRDSVFNSFGAINTTTSSSFANNMPSAMLYAITDSTLQKSLNGINISTAYNLSHKHGLAKGGFMFGANSGVGTSGDDAGFTGSIGDFVVYNTNLTTEERNRVDAYLAIKYGITLDKNESYLASNSNVVWDKTANATYYNNVAGIARDDISDLNQKQSRSQITNNANGEVTVGLGAITTDNVSNAGSFASDQTWFIWGDNGVTTTLDAANTSFVAPGESGARMNRIWKAVNTGLGQAVQLQFPQASISATTGAHYVLAIASDENFTTNVSTVDLATDGSNYTVSFTPRSGTFYFTFARIDAVTPVNLQNFTITTANCNAVLSWTGATESNFNYYEVQTSTDGTSFAPGQQIAGTGSGSHYTAQVTLSAATEYIRLEMVDKDGSILYSDVYTANSNCAAGTPVLYPNPASDVFNITNLGSGQKHIQVFSASGASIYKGQTTADKATVNVKGWAPGLYMVSVVTGNGKTISFKVIVK